MLNQNFWQDFWSDIKHLESSYDICRKTIMNRYDLSAIEVDVLLFLANNTQYDTASDISSIRRIPKSHVSLAVNLLFKKNYLHKAPDDSNKKRVHLVITEQASEIIRFGKKQQEIFTNALIAGFSSNELKQLKDYFKRMTNNLCSYEKNALCDEEE